MDFLEASCDHPGTSNFENFDFKMRTDGIGSSADFDRLPPEMVTLIFEYLETYPNSMLACRLTCHRFKSLIDDILEKRQFSLWSWSKPYGESKPYTQPGPLKRHRPVDKVFQNSSSIDKFLEDMKDHADNGLNPFPNRSIYFRRIRMNLSIPSITLPGRSDPIRSPDDPCLHQIRMRSFCFFQMRPSWGGDGGGGETDSYLLSMEKIISLLEKFGEHLTSMILECGATVDFHSLKDLRDILGRVPNLQYLMLKGVRIHHAAPQNNQENPPELLPPLPHFKSLKIVHCNGVNEALLNSYHHQLYTLQIINNRDYWFPHFERLQRSNAENIFAKLKELKLGEFENVSEFDYFATFLRAQFEQQQQQQHQTLSFLQKLERLSIQYSLYNDFANPISKLFQVLDYLPKLKELNVGVCGGSAFTVDQDEERGKFVNFNFGALSRLSLPVQFIRYPWLLQKIVQKLPTLHHLKFLDCDKLLWDSSVVPEEVLGMPRELKLSTILQELMEQFPQIAHVLVLSVHGDDKERKVCSSFAKLTASS